MVGRCSPHPWSGVARLSFGCGSALIFYVTANRLHKQHWLREYGKVQWAMMIGSIPPLLAMFQQISLVSPIANAFAIPLVSFVAGSAHLARHLAAVRVDARYRA